MEVISSLLSVKRIDQFERQKCNILINLIGYDDKKCSHFDSLERECNNMWLISSN